MNNFKKREMMKQGFRVVGRDGLKNPSQPARSESDRVKEGGGGGKCRLGDREKTFLRRFVSFSIKQKTDRMLIISGGGISGGRTSFLESLASSVGA